MTAMTDISDIVEGAFPKILFFVEERHVTRSGHVYPPFVAGGGHRDPVSQEEFSDQDYISGRLGRPFFMHTKKFGSLMLIDSFIGIALNGNGRFVDPLTREKELLTQEAILEDEQDQILYFIDPSKLNEEDTRRFVSMFGHLFA